MIGDLQAAAKALAATAPDLKAGLGKALEAEVLFELALAATAHGHVVARTHKGIALGRGRRFRLRGGPGYLWAPTAAGNGPSYFAVAINGAEFELHNSLQLVGSSTVAHEMDVSAITRSDADAARCGPKAKRRVAGPPLIGVELKEYGAGKTVDKNLVRAFFACIVDFIPAWAISEVTFGRSGRFRRTYSAPPRADDQFWFLTTGSISDPSSKFCKAHDIRVMEGMELLKLKVAVSLMAKRLKDLASPPAP